MHPVCTLSSAFLQSRGTTCDSRGQDRRCELCIKQAALPGAVLSQASMRVCTAGNKVSGKRDGFLRCVVFAEEVKLLLTPSLASCAQQGKPLQDSRPRIPQELGEIEWGSSHLGNVLPF